MLSDHQEMLALASLYQTCSVNGIDTYFCCPQIKKLIPCSSTQFFQRFQGMAHFWNEGVCFLLGNEPSERTDGSHQARQQTPTMLLPSALCSGLWTAPPILPTAIWSTGIKFWNQSGALGQHCLVASENKFIRPDHSEQRTSEP